MDVARKNCSKRVISFLVTLKISFKIKYENYTLLFFFFTIMNESSSNERLSVRDKKGIFSNNVYCTINKFALKYSGNQRRKAMILAVKRGVIR